MAKFVLPQHRLMNPVKIVICLAICDVQKRAPHEQPYWSVRSSVRHGDRTLSWLCCPYSVGIIWSMRTRPQCWASSPKRLLASIHWSTLFPCVAFVSRSVRMSNVSFIAIKSITICYRWIPIFIEVRIRIPSMSMPDVVRTRLPCIILMFENQFNGRLLIGPGKWSLVLLFFSSSVYSCVMWFADVHWM